MELPAEIAGLVDDLRRRGFGIAHQEDAPWPGGPRIEMRRTGKRGIRRVRMAVDRGIWEVEVQLGRRWYEPYWALRVLRGHPDQSRALNHAERRAATLEAVERIAATPSDRRLLRRRYRDVQRAYNEWAAGPPRALVEALGTTLAKEVERAPTSVQILIAQGLAERAVEIAGLDLSGIDRSNVDEVERLVKQLDRRYFEEREQGDPHWEHTFASARAASALLAAGRDRRAQDAAYEALHAGVPREELQRIATARLS